MVNETINQTINFSTSSFIQTSPIVTNIVIALIIFFLGLVIGRIAGRLMARVLHNFEVDKTIKTTTGRRSSLQTILSTFVSYGTYIVFFLIALNQIGITNVLLTVLSIVIAALIFVTIILSLKDSVPNIVAYRQLVKKKNIRPGDVVEINAVKGTIKKISASETIIKSKAGDLLHVPNALFIKEPFVQQLTKTHNTKRPSTFSSTSQNKK